ncbi:MAG: GntR family transcriptional regulator [Desulfobacterales bacterium]|nr:GntR family transcriptional regulator [Desulfobacterales bacterium]
MNTPLNVSSLRQQVYDYLRTEMLNGELTPGSTINLAQIAQRLGISKTPLRDALIHLELEGFVTILPRRGVRVNTLELTDVEYAYDAVGVVEAAIVTDCFEKIQDHHIAELKSLNAKMIHDIQHNDFSHLFQTNLAFHNVFVELSDNPLLKDFIHPIKYRLYDFQGHHYIPDWELRNCHEHEQFIQALEEKDARKAAGIMKDVHWSYQVQQQFIKQFYAMTESR